VAKMIDFCWVMLYWNWFEFWPQFSCYNVLWLNSRQRASIQSFDVVSDMAVNGVYHVFQPFLEDFWVLT